MSRPLRIAYEDAFYDVMNRGGGRQAIFHDADYYEAFLSTLEEANKRFGIEIHAYCLMRNHYHLLIKTPKANLSRAMRHINGVYTQRHNRMRKTDGALFRGRYKAILVDSDTYLLHLSKYIHRNPLEAKMGSFSLSYSLIQITKAARFFFGSLISFTASAAMRAWTAATGRSLRVCTIS